MQVEGVRSCRIFGDGRDRTLRPGIDASCGKRSGHRACARGVAEARGSAWSGTGNVGDIRSLTERDLTADIAGTGLRRIAVADLRVAVGARVASGERKVGDGHVSADDEIHRRTGGGLVLALPAIADLREGIRAGTGCERQRIIAVVRVRRGNRHRDVSGNRAARTIGRAVVQEIAALADLGISIEAATDKADCVGGTDGDIAAQCGRSVERLTGLVPAMADLCVASRAAARLKKNGLAADGDKAGFGIAAGVAVAFRATIADLRIGFLASAAVQRNLAAGGHRDRGVARSGNIVAAIADLRVIARCAAAGQRDVAGQRGDDRATAGTVVAELCIAIHGREQQVSGCERRDATLRADRDPAAGGSTANDDVAGRNDADVSSPGILDGAVENDIAAGAKRQTRSVGIGGPMNREGSGIIKRNIAAARP